MSDRQAPFCIVMDAAHDRSELGLDASACMREVVARILEIAATVDEPQATAVARVAAVLAIEYGGQS
jgi:hypothetical protein